jgi:endoglycosylceramidase
VLLFILLSSDPSFAVGQAFQALYTNANGFADAFVSFWDAVSSFFALEENVVGFELLNEPYFGDVFENPILLLPGETDRRYLAPLYERTIKTIRNNDKGRLTREKEPFVDLLEVVI